MAYAVAFVPDFWFGFLLYWQAINRLTYKLPAWIARSKKYPKINYSSSLSLRGRRLAATAIAKTDKASNRVIFAGV